MLAKRRLYVLWWYAQRALNSHFHFQMVAVTVISWFMRKKGGRDDFTRPDLSQLSLLFPKLKSHSLTNSLITENISEYRVKEI